MRGYLSLSKDGRVWDKRYVAVHEDFILYVYSRPKDVAAIHAIPLPGKIERGLSVSLSLSLSVCLSVCPVALHEDFILYVYGRPKDVAVIYATPLPGKK